MDIVDKAEEREQHQRDDGIAKARRAPSLRPVGQCYNCGELVGGNKLFCDADCRDDWQKRQR